MSDTKEINLPTKEEIHKLMYDTAHIERKDDHIVVRWEFDEEAEALSNTLEESRKKIASILKEKYAEIERLRNERFVQGYACAVATLLRMEGCDTKQIDELFASGIGSIKYAEENHVDEYDLEILRKFYK